MVKKNYRKLIFLLVLSLVFVVFSSQYVSAWDYCEERDNGVIIWTGWLCFEPGSSLCAGITYKDVCSNGDITEYNCNANNEGYIINRVDCGNNFCATIIPPGDVMCVECLTDNSCPSGERCVNRECVANCIDSDGTDYPPGVVPPINSNTFNTPGYVQTGNGFKIFDNCYGDQIEEGYCTTSNTQKAVRANCQDGKTCYDPSPSAGAYCRNSITPPISSCGDGTCNAGETRSSCCRDCGCAAGQSCQGNSCAAVQVCTSDSQCNDNNGCTLDHCSSLPGGGSVCSNSNAGAGLSCNAGSGTGSGRCDGNGNCNPNAGGGTTNPPTTPPSTEPECTDSDRANDVHVYGSVSKQGYATKYDSCYTNRNIQATVEWECGPDGFLNLIKDCPDGEPCSNGVCVAPNRCAGVSCDSPFCNGPYILRVFNCNPANGNCDYTDTTCTNGCNPSTNQCNPAPDICSGVSCNPVCTDSGLSHRICDANSDCVHDYYENCQYGCSNGQCNPPPPGESCGGSGEACCEFSANPCGLGLACSESEICQSCGELGELCCESPEDPCGEGLKCGDEIGECVELTEEEKSCEDYGSNGLEIGGANVAPDTCGDYDGIADSDLPAGYNGGLNEYKELMCNVCSVGMEVPTQAWDLENPHCEWNGNKCQLIGTNVEGVTCIVQQISAEQCEPGQTTRTVTITSSCSSECVPPDGCAREVPCPRAIKLPFFGAFGFITSIIIITLIYYFYYGKIKRFSSGKKSLIFHLDTTGILNPNEK